MFRTLVFYCFGVGVGVWCLSGVELAGKAGKSDKTGSGRRPEGTELFLITTWQAESKSQGSLQRLIG